MSRAGKSPLKPTAPSAMRLQSKSAQLAEYLRHAMRDGTLAEPLPGMRAWSRQLGVSRQTLHTALRALQRDGVLTLHPRGARLNPRAPSAAKSLPGAHRVRWLIDGTYRHLLHNHHRTFDLLHERLRLRGIDLKSEICTPGRLREIARQAATSRELLLLGSLPPLFQKLFATTGRPALVLGEVAAELDLPFVNTDQAGVVRHATFRLLRQGCTQLKLVHVKSAASGVMSARSSFQQACRAWEKSSVAHQAVATNLDLTSLLQAMRRLTQQVGERLGVLVLAPVPVGMVVTALLQQGIAVPARAEVIALLHSTEAVHLCPPPPTYIWPMQAVVREITRAAEIYFHSGTLPPGGKLIPAELAQLT